MKKVIYLIPNIHNWLADKDFIWWPFSFLRPPKDHPITIKLTFIMAAYFGGLTFLMFTGFALVNNMFSFENLVQTVVFSFLGFFIWFNVITRPLWNIRAKQIMK